MAKKSAKTNYEKLQEANAKRAEQAWREARLIADRIGMGKQVDEADREKLRQFVTSKAKYINKRLKEYETIEDEYQRPKIWHTIRNTRPTGKARMRETYKRASDDVLVRTFNRIDYLYDAKGRRNTSIGGIPTAKELQIRQRNRENQYINQWRLQKWAIESDATETELRKLAREHIRMRDYALYVAGDEKTLYLDDLYDNFTTGDMSVQAQLKMERIIREQYKMRKGLGAYGDPIIKSKLRELIGDYERFAPTGTAARYNAKAWQTYAEILSEITDRGATANEIKSVIMAW